VKSPRSRITHGNIWLTQHRGVDIKSCSWMVHWQCTNVQTYWTIAWHKFDQYFYFVCFLAEHCALYLPPCQHMLTHAVHHCTEQLWRRITFSRNPYGVFGYIHAEQTWISVILSDDQFGVTFMLNMTWSFQWSEMWHQFAEIRDNAMRFTEAKKISNTVEVTTLGLT
jgi:hypothetical protein